MILAESFSIDHIEQMKRRYPSLDIQLIERTIFAFGLLESLAKVAMPFVFKGGTALMLLLEKPYRLSTDIDIIVEPDCAIEDYLQKASVIYPFLHLEEQIRVGKNNIIKKHFKYYYKSPTSNNEIPILLDILFEHHGYEELVTKEIQNEFLLTSGKNFEVRLPTIESILGDKLTAFAPHTTGIEFAYANNKGRKIEKTLEVIKQFLDVSQLIREVKNPITVRNTYIRVVQTEIKYRNINVTAEDCLHDTFNAALSILSRGSLFTDDYYYLIAGIRKIQNHVFGFSINGEVAYKFAAPILLFVAKIINQSYDVKIIQQQPFIDKTFRTINQIRRLDQNTFDMIATAIRMMKLK